MPSWHAIAKLADCPPGSATEWVIADRVIALFNVDGELYALDGVCPHQGGPLGKGTLNGHVVTCPWHGWQFDVRSGEHQVNQSVIQECIPVRVVDHEVQVDLAP